MQFLCLTEHDGTVVILMTDRLSTVYEQRDVVYRVHAGDNAQLRKKLARFEEKAQKFRDDNPKGEEFGYHNRDVGELIKLFDKVCLWEDPATIFARYEIMKKREKTWKKKYMELKAKTLGQTKSPIENDSDDVEEFSFE